MESIPPTTGWLQGPPAWGASLGGITATWGASLPTTPQLRVGSQRQSRLSPPFPSRLSVVGSEALAPSRHSARGAEQPTPPANPCLEGDPPTPRHSQQLNLLFQPAREPPHIAKSRSRLPGVRPGAAFYTSPAGDGLCIQRHLITGLVPNWFLAGFGIGDTGWAGG